MQCGLHRQLQLTYDGRTVVVQVNTTARAREFTLVGNLSHSTAARLLGKSVNPPIPTKNAAFQVKRESTQAIEMSEMPFFRERQVSENECNGFEAVRR